MTEENASTTEQATTETATQAPTSMVNTDGIFTENWRTKLKDTSLHEDETLATIKDVDSLAKSYVHVRKQVPLDKMPRPNDTWGDSDWEEYYVAGGKPDTAADYNINKRRDEIPEELWDQKVADDWQEFFFKHGASRKLVEAISDRNNELILAALKKQNEDAEIAGDAVTAGLRTLWGLAYDQNVHRGEVAINKDKDVEDDSAYKARLLEKVNKDPDLIRFASNMGYKFVEHKIVEDPGIPSPGDIQKQINDIMSDPRFTHTDPEVRKPLIEKRLALLRKLNENK